MSPLPDGFQECEREEATHLYDPKTGKYSEHSDMLMMAGAFGPYVHIRKIDGDPESISITLHTTENAVYDFTINGDGRAHVGRVTYRDGTPVRSTVMAGNFPTTDKFTGITLDPVPLSAMIQGF